MIAAIGQYLRTALLWFAFAVLLAQVGHALAQQGEDVGRTGNAVESLAVTEQAGNVVVKFSFAKALENPPPGFTMANPPRLALDFVGTANSLGRNSQEVDQGDLRSLNMVQVGDRTRIVFNLKRSMRFETIVEGKNLLVTLLPARAVAAGATSQSSVAHFAEASAGDEKLTAIRNIDFRRGKEGEGRVVVDLSDNNAGIDIRQQGARLFVDFIKTSVPDNLKRRYDVVDFGTPVQMVTTLTQDEIVTLVVEPKGNWEHTAYQTENQFVLEVKPVKEDPSKAAQGTRGQYLGEKLSLNFQNIEVRSVLQVIADFTDLNIITSETVTGNLTLRLKDVPWDQALDIILDTKGLAMRRNGNVVWIALREELAQKEKLELESLQQIVELEPTRTETFQLNYQKADAVQKLLSDSSQRILSKCGSAVVDPRTNTLFVQDVPAKLDEVRRLLQTIDVSVRQVLIEARIVEASDTFTKNLGARLGYVSKGGTPLFGQQGLRKTVGANLSDTGFTTGQIATPVPNFFTDATNVNLPAQGIGGFQTGALSLILFNQGASRFLNLELSALEADGRGKIISSPRVVTADQIEALIEQGTELPYQQATSSGATSVSFRKANLSLKVKPQITPDGNVIMTLDINKDSVGQSTAAGFAIDTKHVKTEVLVENGGTVVIGGIYTQDARTTVHRVPFLSDIPLLGNLFKNSSTVDNKTELLVFITPRVLSDKLSVR